MLGRSAPEVLRAGRRMKKRASASNVFSLLKDIVQGSGTEKALCPDLRVFHGSAVALEQVFGD